MEVSSNRTTKEDWLNLAIETLIAEGMDQVKIQVMAKKLNVSRSSFYWFFASIHDLQDQLLDYWLRKNTGPIIERAMRPAPTINRAVCNVFECWIDDSLFMPDLDVAVRFWGRHEAKIRAVLDESDRQRMEALTRMFARYGYSEDEAVTRARVIYFTQIGHFTLQMKETLTERLGRVKPYLLTFTGMAPTQDDMAGIEKVAAELTESRVSL